MYNRTGPKKEQAFEKRMIHHMQQGRTNTKGRNNGVARGNPQQAHAQRQSDDAYILHTAVGQQTFEIVLCQSEKNARQPGDGPDAHQCPAPPCRGRPQKGEHAQQAVQADFDHYAAHQCRHVRRGHWMGFGQPDMQRHKAGLGAETNQGQCENQRGGNTGRCEVREIQTAISSQQ